MATLLYVDDEEAIGRAVRLWLTRRGHVVHVAASAAAARDIVRSTRLDGVFIDLRLGGDSGLDLFQWIDERDPVLGKHAAFVTGDLPAEAVSEGHVRRRVLTKPFELRELDELAAAWGRQHEPRAHPDASDAPDAPGASSPAG